MDAFKAAAEASGNVVGLKPYSTKPALMCSIKGPEIRNSMLKNNKAIQVDTGDKVRLSILSRQGLKCDLSQQYKMRSVVHAAGLELNTIKSSSAA